MVGKVVLLSGPVSVGKSSLITALVERFGLKTFRTASLLEARLERDGVDIDRAKLQAEGERLDKETNGEWVANELGAEVLTLDDGDVVLVDAVRIQQQIEAIRSALGPRVHHVHLTASVEVLAKRYKKRKPRLRELKNYEQVRSNPTEAQVETLRAFADIVIDTSLSTEEDVVVQTAAWLGLYPLQDFRLVDVLVGGQYGSEGKGHIASYLAKEYELLVRVGGPNAGHKVYLDSGIVTHHQLPSGTNTSNAKLLIGPGAVVNVEELQKEIAESSVEATRLSIDPNVMIISKKDIRAEARLKSTIGSTGSGVGAASARRIMGRVGGTKLARDIPELRPYIKEAADVLDEVFRSKGRVFLEGTQGTALSLFHGPYPHVTSRDTTVSGCLAEAGISPTRVRRAVIVCRTYPIRVENPVGSSSGPLRDITIAELSRRSGISAARLRKVERTSTTDRKRRIGEFDWSLLRRASSLNAPTDVALTFADYLSIKNAEARRYEQLTSETIQFIEQVERVAGARVSLVSTRFHYRGIIDRRTW